MIGDELIKETLKDLIDLNLPNEEDVDTEIERLENELREARNKRRRR